MTDTLNIDYDKGWIEEKNKDNPESLHQKFNNPIIPTRCGIFSESLEEEFQRIYEASVKKDKDGNEVYEQGWIEDKSSDPMKFHNIFSKTEIFQDMGASFSVTCPPPETKKKNKIEPTQKVNNFKFDEN